MVTAIKIQHLTQEGFAPFGEVISCDGHDFFHINNKHTERYHALADLKTNGNSKIGISIFRNIKKTLVPFSISMLERHPKGSQAFIPMQGQPFLIVVAPNLDEHKPDLSKIKAFITDGSQGVNYQIGTWHHPLLTLESPSDFAVVDRIGTEPNCDIYEFPTPIQLFL